MHVCVSMRMLTDTCTLMRCSKYFSTVVIYAQYDALSHLIDTLKVSFLPSVAELDYVVLCRFGARLKEEPLSHQFLCMSLRTCGWGVEWMGGRSGRLQRDLDV